MYSYASEAERAFTRALEIDAHSALAPTELGALAIDHLNYEAAEGYLKQACAVEEDPARLTQ
jgi:Tfp pilus assembly protein PilF